MCKQPEIIPVETGPYRGADLHDLKAVVDADHRRGQWACPLAAQREKPATPLEFAIQPRFSRLERIQARNSSRGRVFNTASGVAHPRRALAAP